MPISKVGRRGQTTIPKEIREWTDIREGDRVAFLRRGSEVLLEPLKHTLLELRGSVPVSAAQDFETIRRQIIEARGQRRAKRAAERTAGPEEAGEE
ncbi:MAG: AbrB/MazE/SpoVT family DNA-binding domain-containing protein [Acidobacteriota bacterium]